MKTAIDPEMLKNPVFQRVLREGLAIQDQFSAEPVYARTGKGYLKSTGVAEFEQIKRKKQIKAGQ